MKSVLFSGFPGFLGSVLIRTILDRYPSEVVMQCIVQQRFMDIAEQRVSEIEQEKETWKGRIRLIAGDITLPDLGLGEVYDATAASVVEIYHLAAVYDLGVKRPLAMKVNVDGTRYMLDFAEKCSHLTRFQYVSTCYVSGLAGGVFNEADLIKGQRFNNHYEETKYLAEVEVQQRMAKGLPCTIYRPAIVVGDSKTGKTQKFDGPYYVMQWLLRQPKLAVMPTVGNPKKHVVNIVPSDFVIGAITYLSGIPQSKGKVYQLCDPNPLTVDELLREMATVCKRKVVRIPLTKWLAKGALKYVPGVYALMKIEPEAINYFVHPTTLTCENTLDDLKGSGIQCPSFKSYLPMLVDFWKANRDISSKAMV